MRPERMHPKVLSKLPDTLAQLLANILDRSCSLREYLLMTRERKMWYPSLETARRVIC